MRHPTALPVCLLFALAMGRLATAQTIDEPPRIHASDPHRFSLGGATWYPAGYYPAIGSFTADQGDYVNYYRNLIDKLAANRCNYVRNVFTMGQQFGTSIIPYARTGPGTAADGRPKYNLNQFNQAHFDYWRNIVSYARTKGVVVQVVLLDFWHNNKWVTEPTGQIDREWGLKYDFYQGANNVNGINVATQSEWVNPSHPVFARQKALIAKAVDALGDLPNIVWEVCNEATVFQGAAGTNWQLQLADYITSYEASKGFPRHLVMPRDLPNHEMLSHCLVDTPQVHDLMKTRRSLNQPLFHDNDCTVNGFTPTYRRQKAWACLTAGGHIDFFHFEMRQAAVLASQDVSDGMRFVGYTRKFLADLGVNLVGMAPSDSLVTRGWCLARNGQEYVVYLIAGGTTTLSGLPGNVVATWFNPRTGASSAATGTPTFTTPDSNDWVLHVKAVAPPPSGGTGTGLMGQYYDNKDFTALKVTRTDATVDFDWATAAPAAGLGIDTFSVRWSGQVEAPASGTYRFYTVSDDGVRLWVNNTLIVDNWTDHAATENSGTIALTGGQKVAIRMEYYENGGRAVARLLWSGPGIAKQVVPKGRLYSPSTTLLQINSGGGAVSSFLSDRSVSGGNVWTTTAAVSTSGVANAAPAAVYQSERWGNFTYTLGGLAAGTSYRVRLHFAEIYWSGAGQRLFNVKINGAQVLTNFDVLATAGGKNRAVAREYTATANASGQIVIQYVTVRDAAKSSGIEVLR